MGCHLRRWPDQALFGERRTTRRAPPPCRANHLLRVRRSWTALSLRHNGARKRDRCTAACRPWRWPRLHVRHRRHRPARGTVSSRSSLVGNGDFVRKWVMDSVGLLVQSPVSGVLALARRFEPVLRYTKGELFLPMPVERYVEAAALFRRVPGKKVPELLAPATTLDLTRLISYADERGGVDCELHFVDKPLNRSAYRRWRRRPDRDRFHGGSRFAMVGMFGRIIDSIMRLSLIMRGQVPGGFAAAGPRRYQGSGRAGA